MSKRKTSGLEWLELSMASFNGSGYADKHDAQSYAESYIAYKTWRNDKYALWLLEKFPTAAYGFATELVHANDAGHIPSKKQRDKFGQFYSYTLHTRLPESK